MWPIDLLAHHGLCLQILHLRIGFTVAYIREATAPALPSAVLIRVRALQRLVPTRGASGGKRDIAIGVLIDRRRWRGFGHAQVMLFPAVANYVGLVTLFLAIFIVLALSPGGAEVTFLALAPAADAWGVVRIIYTA